ncbi:hypothetical protein SUGI_1195970 [Cryptomeria japonica]|nr:hypothetical protein SUGI_1195970 [Cryptomeria japonica]
MAEIRMEDLATAYPLVYFDGDQKYDKGHVGVHSLLAYRRFQVMVTQLTGIPPNQQSIAFICRRSKRQRLPVNENTNFGIILNQHNPNREKDCYFLVSVKKPKKDKKGGRGGGGWKRNGDAEYLHDEYDESASSKGDISPRDERPGVEEKAKFGRSRGKPEKTILRRDSSANPRFQATMGMNGPGGKNASYEDWPNLSSKFPPNDVFEDTQRWSSKLQYNDGFEDWMLQSSKLPSNQLQQDETSLMGLYYNYSSNSARGAVRAYYPQVVSPGMFSGLNTMQSGPSPGGGLNLPQMQSQYMKPYVVADVVQGRMAGGGFNSDYNSRGCEQCWMTKERPVPFHCCVNDKVTLGFRGPSPAGPIERPVKASS